MSCHIVSNYTTFSILVRYLQYIHHNLTTMDIAWDIIWLNNLNVVPKCPAIIPVAMLLLKTIENDEHGSILLENCLCLAHNINIISFLQTPALQMHINIYHQYHINLSSTGHTIPCILELNLVNTGLQMPHVICRRQSFGHFRYVWRCRIWR